MPYYTVVNATPAGHTGTYPATGLTEVTYCYKRDDAGNVTVHHFEVGTSNSLAADENLSRVSKAGLSYTTSSANIANFTVVNPTPANHIGTFTAGTNYIVTYEYRRDDAGDVTVMYTDRDGNELDARDILSGTNKLGLPYTTAPKTIGGLVLVNSPTNAT